MTETIAPTGALLSPLVAALVLPILVGLLLWMWWTR